MTSLRKEARPKVALINPIVQSLAYIYTILDSHIENRVDIEVGPASLTAARTNLRAFHRKRLEPRKDC